MIRLLHRQRPNTLTSFCAQLLQAVMYSKPVHGNMVHSSKNQLYAE
jgi:hypothetical protein